MKHCPKNPNCDSYCCFGTRFLILVNFPFPAADMRHGTVKFNDEVFSAKVSKIKQVSRRSA